MMLQKKNKLLAFLLLYCCTSVAQNFTVKAKLQPVPSTGFYSINITPQLSSYTTINYSDLRIADDNNQFVPYIIRSLKPSFVTNNYSKLNIIKYGLADSGKSELIVQNQMQQKISSIALLIRNAAVNRYATISGSDNAQGWFTIAEDIYLQDRVITDTDKYVQTINFPTSSYRFFKITIENHKQNPLNIIEAGSYTEAIRKDDNNYIVNPVLHFVQTDSSDNNTYISIHQTAAYHIEKINLQIESPKFFERNIDVINSSGVTGFKISSGKNAALIVTVFNDSNWTIKIYNGDNPPLKISAVTLQQQLKNMIAYLQQGKNYHLLLHDSAAVKPVYDLQQFQDSIPSNPSQLKILSFENINASSPATKKTLSAVWIWVLIIAALIVLSFVTFRLMKEMGKREQ